MVRASAALLLLLTALPALAAPAYRVEPASVALGEPLSLSITARPELLEKIDLAPLANDFELRDRTQGGDANEANLSLTLYPLRTGRIVLPNLGLPMRAPSVTVLEQSATMPKVRFRFETEPRQMYVRQPVRLTLEACDDGSLMWQRPRLSTQEGVFLRPLNEEQFDVEREGERCTAHRWHWSLQPTVAGETLLPLPMLEANKFGKQLRLPPPQLSLSVLPVPNWLPNDAAVGRPQIFAEPLPGEWPVERPLAWRLEVDGGYSTEALQNLLRLQLAGLPQFAGYAPAVEELAGTSGVPRQAVTLYALFDQRGNAKLPDLVFPWYDPASGSLQQVKLAGQGVAIVDPARQRLLFWLEVLSLLLAAATLGYLLWRALAWRLRRRRGLNELKRVGDLAGLVRQLCAFSLRRHAAPAATLGEWRQRMLQEAEAPGLAELVAAVEAAHYGKQETEFRSLLAAAMACLSAASLRRGSA